MASPRPQAGHGVPNEELFGVSQVIVAGGLAYVAGQIARESDGTPADCDGFHEHVDRAVVNLDRILGKVELERSAVVWVESHVIEEPEILSAAHHRWFEPATTAGVVVAIDSLYDLAYRVELTTIATAGENVPRSAIAGDPGSPFARAIRAGNHIFVSGHDGLGRDGQSGAVADEFGRALDRVIECVFRLGGTPDDVVSTHIYTARDLTEEELLGVAGAHRRRFTGANRPTSNLIGVRRLHDPAAVIEVCGVAVVDAD